MQALFYQMEKRKKELECAIATAERLIRSAPPGVLRVTSCRGHHQYLLMTEKPNTENLITENLITKNLEPLKSNLKNGDEIKKNKIYLGKNKMKQIQLLANKSYAEQFLKVASKELNDINHYLNQYLFDNPETIYSKLHEARKVMANPILIPDNIYEEMWMNESFQTNPFHPEELIYETTRGEFVRSKSEAFLADIYYELDVPYRYEAQVKLKDGTIKYPDFTLLRTYDRQVIYHEHLGLMDDSGYRRDNLQKIVAYAENGITTGKNLILTFEAAGCPFNARIAKKIIMEAMRGEN